MDNWYIRTTKESNEIICNWYAVTAESNGFDKTIGNYIGYREGKVCGYMYHANPKVYFPNCRELSFDEFKELILKEVVIKPLSKDKDYKYLIPFINNLNKEYERRMDTTSR
jgi:hypothetical protein